MLVSCLPALRQKQSTGRAASCDTPLSTKHIQEICCRLTMPSLRCFNNSSPTTGEGHLPLKEEDDNEESQLLINQEAHRRSNSRSTVRQQLSCRRKQFKDYDQATHRRRRRRRPGVLTASPPLATISEQSVSTAKNNEQQRRLSMMKQQRRMMSPAQREKVKEDDLVAKARFATACQLLQKQILVQNHRLTVSEKAFLNRLLDSEDDDDDDDDASTDRLSQIEFSIKSLNNDDAPTTLSASSLAKLEQPRLQLLRRGATDVTRSLSYSEHSDSSTGIEVLSSFSSIFSIEQTLLNLKRSTVVAKDEEDLLLDLSRSSTAKEDEQTLLNLTRSTVAEDDDDMLLNLSRSSTADEENELSLLDVTHHDATIEEEQDGSSFGYEKKEFIEQEEHCRGKLYRYLSSYPRNNDDTPRMMNRSEDADSPYPILGLASMHRILTLPLMEALRGFLPNQNDNYWLKYDSTTDRVMSMPSLLTKIRASFDTIICIQAMDGSVFGSFTRSPWSVQKQGWYGDCNDGSFLFRLMPQGKMEVYPATGNDNFVQYCSADVMAVGGGDWQNEGDSPYDPLKETHGIGLLIDGDLAGGESNSSSTFANPRLFHGGGGGDVHGNEFVIDKMEVWTLTPCCNIEQAERLELKRLMFAER